MTESAPYHLFMILLGCRPPGRYTEQHDVFFAIAQNLAEAKPAIRASWPGSFSIHIDAWREVKQVGGYELRIVPRIDAGAKPTRQLFLVNLGGYKPGEFEEFHYKIIVAAANKAEAIHQAKETAFYKHTGFAGATSHIDDKYGVDVDDIAAIEDILDEETKRHFAIELVAQEGAEDVVNLGYLKWEKI
jgi:hypothetical protein